MSKHDKNCKNNIKNVDIMDSLFPIIPFVHMVYAHISCEDKTIHMNLEYENGKKRKVSIY